jgi:hypothetical protein
MNAYIQTLLWWMVDLLKSGESDRERERKVDKVGVHFPATLTYIIYIHTLSLSAFFCPCDRHILSRSPVHHGHGPFLALPFAPLVQGQHHQKNEQDHRSLVTGHTETTDTQSERERRVREKEEDRKEERKRDRQTERERERELE